MAENISWAHQSLSRLNQYRLDFALIVLTSTANVLAALIILNPSLPALPAFKVQIEQPASNTTLARAYFGDQFSINLLLTQQSVTLSARQESSSGKIRTLGARLPATEPPQVFLRASE